MVTLSVLASSTSFRPPATAPSMLSDAVDPFVFRLVDLRACGLCRLLRRVVGDAGAAYAADVGDQRHLLGDRGRRAACGRRRARRRRYRPDLGARFGFVALIFASVNIFGGFLVTQRMLAMFQRKQK